ncbi:DUF6562 domain-containing protein [Bacteroides uniformis]|uniref:DUF6562 domain-containing protein n=1 Tax=Bacteroides uniformis TaxID=820 RepID=UPI00189F9D59|nr:DUF6562 domain-containing protein [Bacteroides uniformis]
MKKRYYLLFLFIILLTGCVHDYPGMTADGGEGVDPTLVQVNTEVTLDLELVPLEIITGKARSGTTKAAADTYRRRFIIEARRDGKVAQRQVTVPEEAEESGSGKITLPVNLRLHALEYTLAVWTDYVAAGTEADLYYNTEDLQQVSCTTPYTGNTPYRDCLYGTAPLDLRPYRDEWNAKVQVQVDMVRPLAQYEIIATDVKDFLRKMKKERGTAEGYSVTFSYGFYVPLGFNVLTGKPANSQAGVSFTTPLTLPADGSEECTIGTDYIFVNGTESFVVLTMEVKDPAGEVTARTARLEVPYRRGHLTTVRGAFLTNEMKGGVDIDTGFDGDIDFDLDGLK